MPKSWQSERSAGTSTARFRLHWLGLQQGWDLPLGLPLSPKQQSYASYDAERVSHLCRHLLEQL